jgi:death-on-curing protein
MIERFGGSHGLRDRGLLESAVARAENKASYDVDASVAEVAASLAWGLIKNHAFIDGNKRVGFAAMVAFLEENDHKTICSEVEETEMVLRAAAGEITEEQWTVWVMRMTAPKISSR